MGKRLVRWAGILLLLTPVIYYGGGALIYLLISTVWVDCEDLGYGDNTPADFTIWDKYEGTFDVSQYFTDAPYEDVTFSSRAGEDIDLSGWYLPAVTGQSEHAVVLVHGVTSCKRGPNILMAATMLHEAGFDVLLFDLTEHGDSTNVDGRYSAGILEQYDALGAVDYMVARGYQRENIGLFGISMGAGTASMVFAEDPEIAALWIDSGFASLETTIRDELARFFIPSFFYHPTVMMSEFISGVNMGDVNPIDAFGASRNNRPVYITHGRLDKRLSVDYAYTLEEAVQETAPTFEAWIIDNAYHGDAIFVVPEEYSYRLTDFFESALRE